MLRGLLTDAQGRPFAGSEEQPLGTGIGLTHSCPFCHGTASQGRTLPWLFHATRSRGQAEFACASCQHRVAVPAGIFQPALTAELAEVPVAELARRLATKPVREVLVDDWLGEIARANGMAAPPPPDVGPPVTVEAPPPEPPPPAPSRPGRALLLAVEGALPADPPPDMEARLARLAAVLGAPTRLAGLVPGHRVVLGEGLDLVGAAELLRQARSCGLDGHLRIDEPRDRPLTVDPVEFAARLVAAAERASAMASETTRRLDDITRLRSAIHELVEEQRGTLGNAHIRLTARINEQSDAYKRAVWAAREQESERLEKEVRGLTGAILAAHPELDDKALAALVEGDHSTITDPDLRRAVEALDQITQVRDEVQALDPNPFRIEAAPPATPGQASETKPECFIATAVYGDPRCPEVVALRSYRDHVLVRHWLGRSLVAAYRRCSPPLAAALRRRPLARRVVRRALDRVVARIRGGRGQHRPAAPEVPGV